MKSLHLTGIPENKYNKWSFETIFDFLAIAGGGNRSMFLPVVFIVERGTEDVSISYGCQSENKQNQTSQPKPNQYPYQKYPPKKKRKGEPPTPLPHNKIETFALYM